MNTLMDIEVLIPCVNYADFLALTLPITRCLFHSVTVITSPEDFATTAIAQRHGVPAYLTNAWYKQGATFNKAAALNEYLCVVRRLKSLQWILLLDADILFPELFVIPLDTLDENGLYSVRRRMCETEGEYKKYCSGEISWNSFPVNIPPVVAGKVWRHRPTSNPAALSGYFQLWHLENNFGIDTLPDSLTAADYDVEFGLLFVESLRMYIDNLEVMHLGQSKINWRGRTSVPWSTGNWDDLYRGGAYSGSS